MRHFDLCVIGSGSGNSLIDERFAHLDVALIEKGTFGGTCLNVGCIPTKMFVLPADLANSTHLAQRLGVDLALRDVHWREVRDRIFARIDPISEAGLDWRVQSGNVTVFHETAHFVDEHTLQVGEEQITADQIVIAAGSRPHLITVPGIDDERLRSRIHTSDTIMRLDEVPHHLVIVGGGYIAAEFAHIFSACGSHVTLLHRNDRLLRREDADIARRFTELLSDRVQVRMNQEVTAFEPPEEGDEGLIVVASDINDVEYLYEADAVLVATGRVSNSDTLNLEAAGVGVTGLGLIRVDAHQRTSVPHIWALGDVSSKWQLKHVANAEMRTVQHNLLHPNDLVETDHRFVPHAIFSDPQIASVGATEQQLLDWGRPYVSATQEYGTVAYGWALEDGDHFVKLLADPGTWHLLGAHIIGPQAPSLIQPLIQAMSFGQDVRQLARGQYWIHPGLPEVVENALLSLLDAGRPVELEASFETPDLA